MEKIFNIKTITIPIITVLLMILLWVIDQGIAYSNIDAKYHEVLEGVLSGRKITPDDLINEYGVKVSPYIEGEVSPAWGIDAWGESAHKASIRGFGIEMFFCVKIVDGHVKKVVPTYE